MNPDIQRELIPHDDTLHLIGVLDDMKATFIDAAKQWQLLDDTGRAPASPAYAELFQHAADGQALAHDVVHMTAEFARTAYSTNQAGSTVLTHLAMAATMSSYAVAHFADAAEAALALPWSSERQFLENCMVGDHATARGYLRLTSESLRDAVKELDGHLDFHRSPPTSMRQGTAAPPLPPVPGQSPRTR